MVAYLRPGASRYDRAADAVEKSWSRVFFVAFCGGDRKAAAMSVTLTPADIARVALTAPFIIIRFLFMSVVTTRPALGRAADAYTTRIVKERLAAYGNAEYTTDSHTHPSHTSPAVQQHSIQCGGRDRPVSG
ncbi:hypothetical protein [Nocardia sp. NPDC046763]|uniref:hypothetical protein n=1 Tax=Nocardia sp. NPDC046763 TaxID=3155256 RepID=UPI0033E0361D